MLKLFLIVILPFFCYCDTNLFISPNIPAGIHYAITNQNKAYIFNYSNIILEYNFNTMNISDIIYLNYVFSIGENFDRNIFILQNKLVYMSENVKFIMNIFDNSINIFNLQGKFTGYPYYHAINDQNKVFVYTKFNTKYQLEIYDELNDSWTIHFIDDNINNAFSEFGIGANYGYNGIIYFIHIKGFFDDYGYLVSYDYINSNLTYLFYCKYQNLCKQINIILNNKMFSTTTDKYFDLNSFSIVNNPDTSWNFFNIYSITKNFFLLGNDDYPDKKYFFNINLNTIREFNNEYYKFNLFINNNKYIPITYTNNYLNDFTIAFNMEEDYQYIYKKFNFIIGDQSKLEAKCNFNGWYNNDNCICLSNFFGKFCDQCNKGYFGNKCYMSLYCDPFGGNILDGLSGNGSCICNKNFQNKVCSDCIDDVPRYGPYCNICPNCNSGYCQSGRTQNGNCICKDPYFTKNIIGKYCNECSQIDQVGKNCDYCSNFCNGGSCENNGYYVNITDIKCICPPKFRGPGCKITCSKCLFGICGDDGYCKCDIGWSGEFCENKNSLESFPLWAIISSIISFVTILCMIFIYKRYKTLVNENIPRNLDNFFNFRKESNKAYIRP